MARAFTPKVITANALLEGDVVYLTGEDWTRDLNAADECLAVCLRSEVVRVNLGIGGWIRPIEFQMPTAFWPELANRLCKGREGMNTLSRTVR